MENLVIPFEQTEWTAGGGGGFFEFRSRGDAVANELRQSAGGVWRYDGNTRWKLNGYDLGTRDRKVYLDGVVSDPSWKFYPDPIKSPFDVAIGADRDYVDQTGGDDPWDFNFFEDEKEAYQFMLDKQNEDGVEIAAWLVENSDTGKRGVLVLPWHSNKVDDSVWNYGASKNDKGYTITDRDDNTYIGLLIIHTHPSEVLRPSGNDLNIAKGLSKFGIPSVILGTQYYMLVNPNLSPLNHKNSGLTQDLLYNGTLFNFIK